MKIRKANGSDSEVVGMPVFELITELSAPKSPGATAKEVSTTARELLGGHNVWAFLAESDACEPAGVLALNACAAIYAGGYFGEVTELYVRPPFRCQRVGSQLIRAAIEFGKTQGWRRLEVCAPPIPQWDRTVSFYQQNGFAKLGLGLKLLLD
jgi:GNAT superfamily N-acetyltransferase